MSHEYDDALPVVLNWLPRLTALDPYLTSTLTFGLIPGIKVGTTPLAVKEALTLFAQPPASTKSRIYQHGISPGHAGVLYV